MMYATTQKQRKKVSSVVKKCAKDEIYDKRSKESVMIEKQVKFILDNVGLDQFSKYISKN